MSSRTPDVLRLRADLVNGTFDLPDENKEYMAFVRTTIAKAADELLSEDKLPAKFDMGRLIAALDALQHAKNLACDAVILGAEAETRKRKKNEGA